MDRTQLKRAILPASLLLLLFLIVHACKPMAITDLRVAEIRRVPVSDLQDAGLPEAVALGAKAVWKISLEGDANWIEEVRNRQLNSHALVVRCDKRDYDIFSHGPYVGTIPVTYYDERFLAFKPGTGRLRYDIYLNEAGRYTSQAEPNAQKPSYDLGKERLSLCIRIDGGAIYGAHNRSNEVRVELGG